ncbi:L-histidine N(alpha)-methyltransferase [Candidatus Pacearchaeota archaeon]|nr:L-histidine N(alpha)-methyltransferase [Candidatus Pacearchaeota archaeon]
MEFNDLIFKELIKRGYSLEGRTRVWDIADSKLWYLTPEQAQGFLDLESDKNYQINIIQKEVDLINANMESIIKKLGKNPLNMIDIGCGDGKKAVIFIKNLKGRLSLRYCPVDISDYMVEKALENIRGINVSEIVESQYNISDFDNLGNIVNLLSKGKYKNNLFLLLGNTLGNFEINELMYEIRSSMKPGDYLLIGNGLDNRNVDEIVKSYNNENMHKFLIRTLTQIGFDPLELEFGVRFANSRVEMYYTIKKNKVIYFQGKSIRFNKGDQIVVAVSYKYESDEFRSFMQIYFDDVNFYISDDDAYALVLCRK